MSISALLGARLGLEDLTEDEIEVEEGAPLDGSETVEGEMLETGEAEAEVEVVGEQVDVLAEDGEALEAIAVLLDKAVKKGGMGELGLEAINLNLRGIARRANVGNEISASLESFTAKSTPLARTEATLEGVKEMIKGWWASFKAAMAKIFTKIKDFFAQLFNSVPRIAKRASDILASASRHMVDKPSKEKITVSGRDKLCIDNKFVNAKNLSEELNSFNSNIQEVGALKNAAGMAGTFELIIHDSFKAEPLTAEDFLKKMIEKAKEFNKEFTKSYKGGKYKDKDVVLGDYALHMKDLPAEMKTVSEVISSIDISSVKVIHGTPIESSGEERTLTPDQIRAVAKAVIDGCRDLVSAKAFGAKLSSQYDDINKHTEKSLSHGLIKSNEDNAVGKLRADQVRDVCKFIYRVTTQTNRSYGAMVAHCIRVNVAALNYAAKSLDQYNGDKKSDDTKKEA